MISLHYRDFSLLQAHTMLMWILSLPLLDNKLAYSFTGDAWYDTIIFQRPEDEVMFRLKFGI